MNEPARQRQPTLPQVPLDLLPGSDAVHDAVICLHAPAVALSGPDGQLRGTGNHGFYDQDRRLINRLLLRVRGREPEAIGGHSVEASVARFVGMVRRSDDPSPDPTLFVERRRDASPASENVRVWNAGRVTVTLPLEIVVGTDLAEISQVSGGRSPGDLPAQLGQDLLRWVSTDGLAVSLTARPSPDSVDPATGSLEWLVTLAPGEAWTVALAFTPTRERRHVVTVAEPAHPTPWTVPIIRSGDPRLSQLINQSLIDLNALVLADPMRPSDLFLAGGSPWYLTLFGRDSLWAARMMLPLGTQLASGTLRTLGRRQGVRHDAFSEEAPGKILHELRPATRAFGSGNVLPPQYYGSIDATLLFVTVLAEAWRWGMPEDEVEDLLPAAEQALSWLGRDADPGGGGFVKYQRSGSGGLQNQGWKDSHDAVQFSDGGLAESPIALCEVQGYAYEAAIQGAGLLEAFGRPGADEWRTWAADLRHRFAAAFWVEDAVGPYPAIALDAHGRPVDAPASNMGHLLGTGILNPDEARHVATRLGSRTMDSGWGLRTLSASAGGFNPFSYHGGSVWPHDTAIAVAGLAATGHHEQAMSLIEGLLAAAPSFGYRLPELYAGEQRSAGLTPLPYPAACRPQAWSAAASISMLQSILGLRPDVPSGRVYVSPMQLAPPGNSLDVEGLKIAGRTISIQLRDGTVHVDGAIDLQVHAR